MYTYPGRTIQFIPRNGNIQFELLKIIDSIKNLSVDCIGGSLETKEGSKGWEIILFWRDDLSMLNSFSSSAIQNLLDFLVTTCSSIEIE